MYSIFPFVFFLLYYLNTPPTGGHPVQAQACVATLTVDPWSSLLTPTHVPFGWRCWQTCIWHLSNKASLGLSATLGDSGVEGKVENAFSILSGCPFSSFVQGGRQGGTGSVPSRRPVVRNEQNDLEPTNAQCISVMMLHYYALLLVWCVSLRCLPSFRHSGVQTGCPVCGRVAPGDCSSVLVFLRRFASLSLLPALAYFTVDASFFAPIGTCHLMQLHDSMHTRDRFISAAWVGGLSATITGVPYVAAAAISLCHAFVPSLYAPFERR